MSNLINDAKEIIEKSLESDADKSEYSLRANDWLKRFEAAEKTHQEDHGNKSEASCSICGFDLICPTCAND